MASVSVTLGGGSVQGTGNWAVHLWIIVLAGHGAGVRPTADELGIGRSTVQV